MNLKAISDRTRYRTLTVLRSREGHSMLLGNGVVMRYILRSRTHTAIGIVEAGTVERDGFVGLTVRDEQGTIIPHLSGTRIRSWNIVGPDGLSIDSDIVPDDYSRLRWTDL